MTEHSQAGEPKPFRLFQRHPVDASRLMFAHIEETLSGVDRDDQQRRELVREVYTWAVANGAADTPMAPRPDSPYLFDVSSAYTIGLGDLRMRLDQIRDVLMGRGDSLAIDAQAALDILLQIDKRDADHEAAYVRVQRGHIPCRVFGCVDTFSAATLREEHEHWHDYGDEGCGDEDCDHYCNTDYEDD